jgi:NAD(P)-dependent dehydrogenase (short-subunit alcohol dehydrogenase family)
VCESLTDFDMREELRPKRGALNMARVFVIGTSTGLGLQVAQQLGRDGHEVVLHARDEARAADTRRAASKAAAVVVGDLETMAATRDDAAQANAHGPFDAVIHNAAVYNEARRETSDGVPSLFAVNVLAPYLLTALIGFPRRLVYMSSGMHLGARACLDGAAWRQTTYSQSKLYILMLASAVARRYPDVLANGMDPGWVPTRTGGAGAPDDLEEGAKTQAALAAPEPKGPLANASQQYFHHMRARSPDPQSLDVRLQDRLLEICRALAGVALP